jgi:hypothetical protein
MVTMAETWVLHHKQLKVEEADEDGFASNGDEPFVAAIGFRSRMQTPGSTSVFWNGMLDDTWGDHAKDGSVRDIPEQMGLLRFDNVERPGLAQFLQGARPEVIGRVTIVVESDGTPWGTIKDMLQRAQGALHTELVNLVELGQFDTENPAGSVEQAARRVQEAATSGLGLGDWFESGGDPDDPMGQAVDIYAAVDPALASQVPLPILQETGWDREFKDSDTRYRVFGDIRREPVLQWSGWHPLGGQFPKGTSAAAVVRKPNTVELFARGLDNRQWQDYWPHHETGDWSGWFQVDQLGVLSADATACARRPENLDLFHRGTDGQAWTKWWTDADGWVEGWRPLGGQFPEGSKITAVSRKRDHIDLFARGMDGCVWQNWWPHHETGDWAGWFQVDPAPVGGSPTAYSFGGEHVQFFVQGTDGQMWSKWWTADQGWSAWEALGGQFPAGATFAPISRMPGHVDVFARGLDDHIWQQYYSNGWSGWFRIDDAPVAGDPTVMSFNQDHVQLFVQGTDGQLWTKWWTWM